MLHHATWEVVLFVFLAAVSGFFFFRSFYATLRTIWLSRKDDDFRLRPIGKRIWEFIWEVVCQAKVIRERPLAGIAHAFVFWGFCAFAIVTIDHALGGFNIDWLRYNEGYFGPAYFFFAFTFAFVVALSMLYLAIRRFLWRPKWLGPKVSWQSGVIAILILSLMLTYIADYVLQDHGAAGRFLWWTHTAALLLFLPLIPRSKHLHLILSPLTVFLSRGEFSRIPPLAGDEDFGLDTGKDVTRLLALQAYSCVECGRCQEHCPAANTGKILNPKEIAMGLRSYLKENGPQSEKPLLGVHLSEEAAFQCTTCGACEFQCPVGIEHLPLIVGLRRGAVNTGKWEDDYGTKLFLSLERNGNPLGMAASERDKFIQKSELPIFDGTQEYCLWMGCMGSYDPQGREVLLDLVRVLRFLKVSFGVLKKERCTGDSARRLGNDLVFQQLAEANIQQLTAAKATKLLSTCPHCVRTIGSDWKEFGAAFQVEHHSVFLARHQHRFPVDTHAKEKVVFHDPCYLGRYQDIYAQPRSVVKRFHDLKEARLSHERSFCCGAGGGLAFLGEEKGKRVSHERAEQLIATGATTVAAACPFCNTMFRDALPAVSPTPPKLLDIAQIAAANLPPGH